MLSRWNRLELGTHTAADTAESGKRGRRTAVDAQRRRESPIEAAQGHQSTSVGKALHHTTADE